MWTRVAPRSARAQPGWAVGAWLAPGELGMFLQLPGGWRPGGTPVLISLSISAKKEQLSSNSGGAPITQRRIEARWHLVNSSFSARSN